MEEIIRVGGIAVTCALGLAILVVIALSQWSIWQKERRQEQRQQHK